MKTEFLMNARYESEGSRTPSVKLCLLLFGCENRDQLSQTDDFVQIYLIYP